MMHKTTAWILGAIALLLALSYSGNAQEDLKMRIPVISLGRIHPPEVKNGKPVPTLTTRNNVLKLPMLTADLNNCRVTEYKFSMIAPGRPFYGPFYIQGGDLTDSIKSLIRATDGPGVKLYFDEIHMLYRGETMDANPVYVQYDE
ncbi:hypothetical protein GCM10023093_20670 [Nemorincola caseinilytica]|uniref:Uncharacterized protein n=1 Tax=Nemorincola caseinilytica TaxID=2054315 RepID=A0ABP8NIM9_9BACT